MNEEQKTMSSPLPLSRPQLIRMALVRLVAGILLLSALLLLPAGTLNYWQAWVYLATLFIPMGFVFAYLIAHDPALLERRMRMKEKQQAQARIIKLGSLCYALIFLLPGFDLRFGLSEIPPALVLAADACVLLGYALFIRVLLENSYASRIIEVAQDQRVITTGPYARVRHPMYSAILLMFLATPVALGSGRAMLPAVLLIAVIVARIIDEERLLANELKGYAEYMQSTRYRLLPGIW